MEKTSERAWLLSVLVVLIGAFMSLLDASIVNVAIPSMMRDFNVDTSTIGWVVTIYMLALGVVVPLSGWLGDTLGYKKLYIYSLAAFTLGSLLCALSWNIGSLVAARVIQAIGGGMIMPTTMAMVYRLVPRQRIGSAMGILGIALLVAPAIGPTLGGYLVEYVDWRWIFTINLPIGALGVLLSLILVPDFPSKPSGKVDIGGALTSAVTLFTLLLALTEGSSWGWSSQPIVLLFYTSAVSFGLFVYLELTSPDPLLDLRLFRDATFTLANVMVVISTIGLFSGIFYLPLFLQTMKGLGAMEAGLLMMPGALVSGLVMPVSGRLYDKVGPRPLAILGLALLGFSTYLFHRIDLNTPNSTIVYWSMLRGMAMGFAMMPAQTAALSGIPTAKVGRASALNNVINRVSGSFGIAALTAVLNQRVAAYAARLAEQITPASPPAMDFLRQAGGAGTGGGQGLGYLYLQGMIARYSFTRGVEDIFLIAAAISLIGLLPAIFLKKGQVSRGGMVLNE